MHFSNAEHLRPGPVDSAALKFLGRCAYNISAESTIPCGDCDLRKAFDSRKFIQRWKRGKDKKEWLFALAIVKAGLQREGNLDETAEKEIARALDELNISAEELRRYLDRNRAEVLRLLDSRPE